MEENYYPDQKGVKSVKQAEAVNMLKFKHKHKHCFTSSKLSVMYTNADCLTNKVLELRKRVESEDVKPNIIGIVEVKPKNARYQISPAEIQIQGYDIYTKGLQEEKGRGLVLYIRRELEPQEVNMSTDFEECIWAKIKLRNSNELVIGLIYRSPTSTALNNESLNKLCSEVNSQGFSHQLIMGDFNYRNIDWDFGKVNNQDEDSEENKFLDATMDCFWYQHVKQPTRGRGGDKPSLLDLVFTNEERMINNLKTESPLGKSDHCVIKFELECYSDLSTTDMHRFNWNKGDYERMKIQLDIDWKETLSENKPVDEIWQIFHCKLMEAIEDCIPKKPSKDKYMNRAPLDKKTLELIRKKHRCWQRYIETRDELKYKEYCRSRNRVKAQIRKHQKNVEKNIAIEAKKNPKRFWAYVRTKTSTKQGIPQLERKNTDEPTKETTTDKEKAEELSSYFASVFTKELDGPLPDPPVYDIRNRIQDINITEEVVCKKLKKLDINKSYGPDRVPPVVLQKLADVLTTPLTIIFQNSLEQGKVPLDWKRANISALFKKGKRNQPDNYRPVSLTSIPCKVMESVIRDHLLEHLEMNKVISNKQFGFVKGRSTTSQLYTVMEDWTRAIDDGVQVDVAYTDFMKAFDKVPHERLLLKLESFGICGKVLQWLRTFLTNRKQRVIVNHEESKWEPVSSGIPQGTVLGPICFILYINDLPLDVDSDMYLFADDTKIYRKITNVQDALKFQEDINRMEEWSNKWLLRFHPDKCKVMTVGKAKNVSDYQMKFRTETGEVNHHLSRVSSEKDLGVKIDESLSFEDHIYEKIKKANSIMGIIRRTYLHLDEETFCLLYKALVRPHLEYGNAVWAPYKKKLITAIEKVQRRATKQIPGLGDLPYS